MDKVVSFQKAQLKQAFEKADEVLAGLRQDKSIVIESIKILANNCVDWCELSAYERRKIYKQLDLYLAELKRINRSESTINSFRKHYEWTIRF